MIREEIFEHPDWWQTKFPISDLNETAEEFNNRVAYLNYIEPNPIAISEDYYSESQLDYENIDEYRARRRDFFLSIDMDVDEKAQDGYYLDDENIRKDMLGSQISFDKAWYKNYLDKNQSN